MLKDKVLEKLNFQINRELYSAYFYLGMATYAASIGLKGFANWFDLQVKEEAMHAEKLYKYVNEQGSIVRLGAIEEPPQDFTSALDLCDRTLKHEKKVTGLIHDLVKLAKSQGDKATEDFLQWFIKEQVEEEMSASRILKLASSAGDDKHKLAEADAKLAERRK